MAKIPVKIDPRSRKEREVTVVFYVDGKEYSTEVYHLEEFAIPQVIADACVQLEDPDYQRAFELAREGDSPLPPGYK